MQRNAIQGEEGANALLVEFKQHTTCEKKKQYEEGEEFVKSFSGCCFSLPRIESNRIIRLGISAANDPWREHFLRHGNFLFVYQK